MKEVLKKIPPIHELLKNDRFSEITEKYSVDTVYASTQLKSVISEIRQCLLQDEWEGAAPGDDMFVQDIFQLVEKAFQEDFQYTLKKAINATGTILHTNLGRARMSEESIKHVIETAQSYSNLEYDLLKGERGSRHIHAETLIKHITGAEAAMVVNNNAAAVYFILKAFAENREVIVSRGQLVEIGGSFRVSSIMEESGARLVEVGTTNKTHIADYENAIHSETAMIMKVHTSNFRVIGFTKTVETGELAQLASQNNVLFYEDLGSGALYDFRSKGIGDEPTVKEVLAEGVHLVSFSGDKLLGGPQAGIIAGKKELIQKLKKHQLARVLRVDKMTLAALEGTLMHYVKGSEEIKKIPVIKDMLVPLHVQHDRALHFAEKLARLTTAYTAEISESIAFVGGGTMPDVELPSYTIAIRHQSKSAEQLAKSLRTEKTAIVARIKHEELHLDLRTVTREEEQTILEALQALQ
ncbi:L-seryl-tRNA(Sec) selenium transferase [Cytobacillus gottheilii]|uniref:L-seryl-tRNA(Sec) selenium transferase n=1 Tax=Cytobacillus gottheilii TaxID=859144 RepID=UPI0009BA0C7C|nr:L-seryl-tRNA(Sec) selenium transferase [Cytobacillus gottheilii]